MVIKKHKQKNLQSGLTLVELVVILAIVAVVSGVLIFNYSNFRDNTTIRGLSQEVALAVRKAQTYATSVRSITSGSTTNFPAYGISFSANTGASNSATPNYKKFILFANIGTPPNSSYDNGGTCTVPTAGNECLENFTINSVDTIMEACADVTNCVSGTTTLDIIFERPSPDAKICINGSCSFSSASIRVGTALKSRVITIWNTGQISVQ